MRILGSFSSKTGLIYDAFGRNLKFKRFYSATVGCSHINDKDITAEIKQEIERHWSKYVRNGEFEANSSKPKQYVLSMFPYPSGFLHMGHVRVYTISDAMARFYKLNGMNVIHPMGWDAFGLPAENAAIQRKVSANEWTKENISHMRTQLENLGCAFDWNCEFATCDATYYHWTQKLFLMLFHNNLAYQKEALVNWDPVDQTVLADEQVDANGCSWRSGAKVEKKLLRQWFVKTTKFAKELYDGLDDPILEDWRDIVKLQKHWIGECDGYSFEFEVPSIKQKLTIWTKDPTELNHLEFIAIKSDHSLAKHENLKVFNPINQQEIPLIVKNDLQYPDQCDTFLGIIESPLNVETKSSEEILQIAKEKEIGGYRVSSKLKDWLISRQRYWGTPIPIIHCNSCGSVPVPESDLPVQLPLGKAVPLSQNDEWIKTKCPKCGSEAKRETDTMDTFVDSSWYYLRFLDPKNTREIFDKDIAHKFMPVDLYVGGKEHAVLHLYYARFINHFLHSLGLVPHPEPFKRLLVQGMVMGQSYKVKSTGKYIPESEVTFTDDKKSKAIETSTNEKLILTWEKMSKSKFNGVDPEQVINELGCDALRLIMLADVAPTSHRNWSATTFPGILMWQNRIWLSVNEFLRLREENAPIKDEKDLKEHDERLLDARNFYVAGVTFNYKYSHQLSVAISKMQGLTNSLRKSSKDAIAHSPNYERALMTLLVMISPMAPHFASELWSRFLSAPHRKSSIPNEINWDENVLAQKWPEVDLTHELSVGVKVNCIDAVSFKFPRHQLDLLKHEEVLQKALDHESVLELISNINITSTKFELYPGCHGLLNIFLDQPIKTKKEKKEKKKKVAN